MILLCVLCAIGAIGVVLAPLVYADHCRNRSRGMFGGEPDQRRGSMPVGEFDASEIADIQARGRRTIAMDNIDKRLGQLALAETPLRSITGEELCFADGTTVAFHGMTHSVLTQLIALCGVIEIALYEVRAQGVRWRVSLKGAGAEIVGACDNITVNRIM